MEARVYECESKEQGKLKAVLEREPYAPRSFSRQGYKLKDGGSVGGESGKYYAYMKADGEFFKWAEERFKEVPNMKRCEKALEEKLKATIEEQESSAEAGFGSLFG
ncbi:MAG: hypothetical protein NT157_05660 [Candidatus Micrarchaeota archaeon]|nr:hypothetical protein [Candidatus Micrarchaeota archaeon]